jgi:tRNA nucleotidyltransferase (CCA-adding enzyme)
MKIYLVGGAVRDELLGLPVHERDWVVVGATAAQMRELGYRPADAAFPVFLHPESGEEYALARTERKTGPGYKGFEVEAGPDVTLEQDLRRRDLTINALAKDESGKLIDFCNGREDLEQGILRHISPAFTEDPVRLLRVARFAAKLGQWGFRVAHGTHALMKKMAASSDIGHLRAERVKKELWRALGESQPWRFFEVLHRCGALARLLPEVDLTLGAVSAHGPEPAAGMEALKRAVGLSDDPVVRGAAALFAAATQVPGVDDWFDRLRAGREEAQLLRDLLAIDGRLPAADDAAGLLRLAGQLKPAQQPRRFQRFVLAARALWPESMVTLAEPLASAAEVVQRKPPEAFYRQGLSGAGIGEALSHWREEALRGQLQALRQRADEDGS